MYFIGAALPISLSLKWQFSNSNLASLSVKLDRKHVDEVFLSLLIPIMSFAQPLTFPPKMSLHQPLYVFLIPLLPFSYPNQILLLFKILTPQSLPLFQDTPITTSPLASPLPPCPTHRTRQVKHSIPSLIPSSSPSPSPSTPQPFVPSSPPNKTTSPTNSTSKNLEDIQNYLIMITCLHLICPPISQLPFFLHSE